MPSMELMLVSIVRALVEVAGYALLGQGVLAVFAGKKRDDNFVYRLLVVVTAPIIRAVRFATPSFILDRHLPFVAFFLLFWLWLGLAFAKRHICAVNGLGC